MAIVGFEFTNISAKKNKKKKGSSVSINNNISIESVELSDATVGSKDQKLIVYGFTFKSTYEPDLGSIQVSGEVLSLENKKIAEDIEKSWKKDKKVPPEHMKNIISSALNKCNIQALIVSQTVNLPPPIPLPKVQDAGQKK